MTDEEKLIRLAESNMELSLMLFDKENAGRGSRGELVSYLFGKPLNEIYDILLEHENRNG
jgi:hypothetical protein